ncbi:MAG: hypothetical protein ACJAYU_000282 [Bradymonadia bacterium]|jgi:hypothetical protein
MRILTFLSAGLIAGSLLACDPGTIPNRNTNDCSHEITELTDTIDKVTVSNPNNVRVGTEWRIRIMPRGEQGILRESVEHLYIAAMQDGVIDVDFSDLCGENTPEGEGSGETGQTACEDLYAHAVMLQTYWIADE